MKKFGYKKNIGEISRNPSYEEGYKKGQLDMKNKIIETLKKDIQNLDLSTDSCDKRYIEEIKKIK